MSKLAMDQCALVLFSPKFGYLNKYANYNKELTELNSLIFLEKANFLPDEICKTAAYYLLRANKAFGLSSSEELKKLAGTKIKTNIVNITSIDPIAYQIKLANQQKQITKTALNNLNPTQFALPNKKKYPLVNEESIKTAILYFDAYHENLSPVDKITFAINTKKAADIVNLETNKQIDKYASLSIDKLSSKLKLHINSRKDLTTNKKMHKLYDDLLEKAAELEPMKVATVLRRIDEMSGIVRHWGKLIEEPLTACLETIKEASITINDRVLTKTALIKLCEKDLSKWIDTHTLKELKGKEGLQVFASLPQPTKISLLQILDKSKK